MRNKYGAKRTDYNGATYDSKREAKHAAQLDLLIKAKDIEDAVIKWERQVEFPLVVNGQLICLYRADFRVWYPDGRCEIHEVKGMDTQTWRLKAKLFKALHPELLLKVIR